MTKTMRLATGLPLIAAGAVAVYAYAKTRGRAGNHGPMTTADRDSDTRQQLGGPSGIHVEEVVMVSRSVPAVYRFWRNFENFPTFMRHLYSVSQREEGISHWVAHGPAGMRVEWDARIINEIDNRLVAWQSLAGSTISTAGSVNFRETPGGGTEVRVHLQYNPPAGRMGAALAWLFGEEPSLQIREDLQRFKQLIETGAIARKQT